MSDEKLNYRNNVLGVIDKLRNTSIEEIYYEFDNDPTFDQDRIPFKFYYCYSILIVTKSEVFKVHTSGTDSGLDTFWISAETELIFSPNYIKIDSPANEIHVEYRNDYAFKITIELNRSKLIIYCGEIYDAVDGGFRCVLQDERIFVFQDETDANIFEKLCNSS